MPKMKNFEIFNKKDIFASIENEDIQSVENYINSVYDLNVRDKYGYTPLNFAAHENNIKIKNTISRLKNIKIHFKV